MENKDELIREVTLLHQKLKDSTIREFGGVHGIDDFSEFLKQQDTTYVRTVLAEQGFNHLAKEGKLQNLFENPEFMVRVRAQIV